ncbi:DUF1878 family protein [Bacillus sp. FSL K6-3431]|uniref:DUF1878 family protein n=1 Tax=Bacillus sp. FSL K6-3431 TaxID=2921500 RepID=UPI0030F63BE8
MDNLVARLERLEYYQQLLINMVPENGHEFDQLIIRKNLDEKEVKAFYALCEEMSMKVEEEKAAQFVFHAPLFKDFLSQLNPKLNIEEVIDACERQKLFLDLMKVLQKNM